jgi:translocation and assembly module TamB
LSKKRILRNLLIGIASLIVCLILICIIVVNTNAFRDFLRAEISKQALASAGARVDIESIETHWTHLGVDLNNIVVHGSEAPDSNEPVLARASRLEVGLRFAPLLHGRFELRKLVLEQPVVHLRVDSQGRSNLPTPTGASSSGNGPGTIFDLQIGECTIRSGEIDYNDAQIPLDADLHGLKFNAAYSHLAAEYKGSLSYDNGRISAPQFEPIAHTLQVQFTATRAGLSLSPLQITTADSRMTVKAEINDYASPSIDGTYEGNIETSELAKALRLPSLPIGNVALAGKLAYQPNQRRAFLATLNLQGQASSGKLKLRTAQQSIEATQVSVGYELKDATLRVQNLAANILDGRARANWQMQNVGAANSLSRLDASVKGVSLAIASNALAPRNVQRIPFAGTSDLDLRAAWTGSINNIIAHAHLVISSQQQAMSPQSIPVNGLIQADYSSPKNTIAFTDSHLQTSNTKLTINGILSSRRHGNSALDVDATTTDLREVTSLATMLQAALQPSSPATKIPDLTGSATLNARVTGTANEPHFQGKLNAQNFTIDASHWQSLALNVNADPSALIIQNGSLKATGNEQINFSGKARLQDWSLEATSPIELQVSIANMPAAAAQEIAHVNYPVTGTLSGKIAMKGTRASPDGTAAITLTKATAWNEAIDNLTVNAESHEGGIHSNLKLQIPAGTISAEGNYTPATQEYDVKLHSSAIQLEKIVTLQKRTAVEGTADVAVMGSGTISNPQLEANFASAQLQTQGHTISNIAAKLSIANQHANFDLHSIVEQGSVEAKGDIALTGDRYTTATLDVHALPVAAVAANFFPTHASKLGGQTEIHLTLKGPLKTPEQIEAHLEIPSLNITYANAQLALARPLHADYRNGTLTISPAQIQGTGTNLTFGGTIPLKSQAAYALVADGTMDLAVLQQFAPDVRSSGQMEVHIHSEGSASQPNMRGQFEVKNAVFTTQTLPVGIEGLNAKINLSGNRADIVNLSGTAGGGTVSATGFVDLARQSNFNLHVNAQTVRIRYPAGLRSILSGQMNLQGSPDNSTLTGRVLINSLSFTQAFDLANFVANFSQDSTGAPQAPLESNMRLSVAIQSAEDISLKSSKLSMGGTANLNLTGTLAQPVILGRVALNGGEVFFLSKRFEVQNGTIEFGNPVRTDPVVNLYITTTIEQYNVTLNLTGPADRLRINYTSDPALASADIIHLLAFGNTTAEAASAPSQSAAASAESVLAQGVSGQVTGKIESLTGISQLTLDPLATNSQGDPGTQIAVQERVTGNLLVTFGTNVTSTQNQTVQLRYDLNKRVSVTVLRDQNGGYGIDLRLHRAF